MLAQVPAPGAVCARACVCARKRVSPREDSAAVTSAARRVGAADIASAVIRLINKFAVPKVVSPHES